MLIVLWLRISTPRGATCSKKTIQEGSSIGTEWELAHCTRSGNAAVLITLQAAQNMGSTSQKLDAAEAADTPKTMQVEFRTDHPPIGAPIEGQCQCLSISPSTDNAGHKTANVRNDCSGTVTILGVKDTQSLPAVPEDALFRPREGRWFGYAELEQHMTAVFDGTGAVGLFHVEEFSCPGNEMRHILRCQAGQLQPPPAATCYLQDGIVGERCTCPNGANGITTF